MDNPKPMKLRGYAAINAAKTSCPKGHQYEFRYGKRYCMICTRARSAEFTLKRRQQKELTKKAFQ